MDIRKYNRLAWNAQVAAGNPWTVPVDAEVVARARRGDWSIVLTPRKAVPRDWFPPLPGARVLALASGGGQQGPVLAAAGAHVTVFDNSPAQLAQDRAVAEREGLDITLLEGDMADLSGLDDGTFDLIVHPVSNCFVPQVRPVWREAARVLKRGGVLLAGFCNPIVFLTDPLLEAEGIVRLKHAAPYADLAVLTPAELRTLQGEREPLTWGHTLEDQIAGQTDAGLHIAGFYEDAYDPADDALSRYLPCFCATRAVKP